MKQLHLKKCKIDCNIFSPQVIDFNSLLDDYLKGLQSEEDLSSSGAKKGAVYIYLVPLRYGGACDGISFEALSS